MEHYYLEIYNIPYEEILIPRRKLYYLEVNNIPYKEIICPRSK